MRAELACTIVLCILGLISQMKVWKMVKERKAKKEEERLQDESHRDQRDSRIGKMIEKRNSRSLAAWEAAYGDQDSEPLHTDSGTGTSMDTLKKSASVREREIGAVELDELDTSTNQGPKGKNKSYVAPRDSKDEEAARAGPGLDLDLGYACGEFSWWDEFKSSKSSPNQSKKNSVDNPDPNEPPIPALPFSPLMEQSGSAKLDIGGRDVTAMSAQEGRELPPSSLEQNHREDQSSFEISGIEDDRASSVAATVDEEPDFDALSKRFSVAGSVLTTEGLSQGNDEGKDHGMPETPGETPMEERDNEELIQPISQTREANSDTRKDKTTLEQTDEASAVAELKDGNLPTAISKVAHVYRTNEWAKHIAEADQPEIVEELDPDEPAVHVDVGRTEEAPRPVDTKVLSPEQLQPQFFKTATNPYRQNSGVQKRPSSSGTPVYSFQRQGSSSSTNQTKREVRSASKPLAQQPLVESLTEESFAMATNLMDERNVRVSIRPTTANFNGITSPSNAHLVPPTESPNVQAQDSRPIIGADMTLAQRKSLVLGQMPTEPRQAHPSSSQRPSTSRRASTSNQNRIYDSHQPRRFSSVNQIKQNAMLTQWRQSLQQETNDQPTHSAEQRARQSMIDQLRYKDHQELKQQTEKKKRESMIELAMRTSNLTDKHRSAMRKMQAQANEASKQ